MDLPKPVAADERVCFAWETRIVLHEIPEHDKAAIVDALREDGFVLCTLDPGASDRQVQTATDVLYDLARQAGVSALVTSTRADGFVNLAVETVDELR